MKNWHFKKNNNNNNKKQTLNSHISKTKISSEWEPKFSESSFNFLQNSVLFGWLYPCEQHRRPLKPPAPLPAARGAQRVNDDSGKKLNLLFFVYLVWKSVETFKNLKFSIFGQRQCLFLNYKWKKIYFVLKERLQVSLQTLSKFQRIDSQSLCFHLLKT